ncbi:DUF484 family protein [Tabrizicola piscis]|jgi:uncharacterized protein|uniref:DUF484 family protein n=1 Tax=Tabrizicola piscis TaxID=2494374 RepID=A0A3S8U4D2_9RHOB|nr:DUF484 family protein [Tabrizicola piscis]AZL58428.1 DUF484 family protein [Tabrizicola piscis]
MIEPDLRTIILAQPERLLEDRDVMSALVGANERAMGENIVDLRGIAMQRLETRLDRLEDTHRSVIAAAYENLAGTNQVHRAILQLLDPPTFEGFMQALSTEVAQTLRVDIVRLVLETVQEDGLTDPALRRLGDVLHVAPRAFVGSYLTNGRNGPARPVVLRQTTTLAATVYGDRADDIRSEALMKLDFGKGRLPAMLVFGSEDPHQFKPIHGTDLLAFFAGVFERKMRHWLG